MDERVEEPTLHYWTTTSGGNAEIDYLVQCGSRVVPVEVKSGASGAMKSLQHFMAKYRLDEAGPHTGGEMSGRLSAKESIKGHKRVEPGVSEDDGGQPALVNESGANGTAVSPRKVKFSFLGQLSPRELNQVALTRARGPADIGIASGKLSSFICIS